MTEVIERVLDNIKKLGLTIYNKNTCPENILVRSSLEEGEQVIVFDENNGGVLSPLPEEIEKGCTTSNQLVLFFSNYIQELTNRKKIDYLVINTKSIVLVEDKDYSGTQSEQANIPTIEKISKHLLEDYPKKVKNSQEIVQILSGLRKKQKLLSTLCIKCSDDLKNNIDRIVRPQADTLGIPISYINN